MCYFKCAVLAVSITAVLVGCGGGGSSYTPPAPTPPTIPLIPVSGDMDISGIVVPVVSLPAGWENSKQSLVVSSLPNVESDDRMTAKLANQTPIVQSAKKDGASLANTKAFADNLINNLNNIKRAGSSDVVRREVNFSGTKTSELLLSLNDGIRFIIKNSMEVDAVIPLDGLKDVIVECQDGATFTGKAQYETAPNHRPDFLNNQGLVNQIVSVFSVNNAENIQIKGCGFENTQAIIANNSKNLNFQELTIKNSSGYGIIIGQNNQNVIVDKSVFNDNYASGILVLSGNKKLVLINNQINAGKGYSAWHSGIVVTDKKLTKMIGQTDFLFNNDYLMPKLDIDNVEKKSSDIYIIKNQIRNQVANGILLDGVQNSVISNNQIQNNNREGLELLNSHSVVISKNTIKQNGQVMGVPTQILERQFPIVFKNHTDSSSRLKDSGITLDNTSHNLIVDNTIDGNYGSGIYARRGAFYNIISENSITNNNLSRIDNTVLWYNGINLNSMPQAEPSNLVMFVPSMGNVIYKNTITGGQQNGIEFCVYCEDNEVLENNITSPLTYSIKQYLPRQQNLFKDNTSNAKSENTNLNANGSGGAKAGAVETRDWGSGWLNDNGFKGLIASQNELAGVNNLFIGSSTIRLWNLERNFPNYSVANRGFGGAESFDVKSHLDILLGNSQPKAIFVYVGENDIASNKGVERTLYHIQQNLAYMQLFRPAANLTYIGVKPSMSRIAMTQNFEKLNQGMKVFAKNHRINYIETSPLFQNTDGSINEALFSSDRLHLNESGYVLLADAVRPYLK